MKWVPGSPALGLTCVLTHPVSSASAKGMVLSSFMWLRGHEGLSEFALPRADDLFSHGLAPWVNMCPKAQLHQALSLTLLIPCDPKHPLSSLLSVDFSNLISLPCSRYPNSSQTGCSSHTHRGLIQHPARDLTH